MSVQVTARQPAGVPVGGQFTAAARTETDVTLTANAPVGFVPADLTGLDDDDLAVLRRGVHAKLDAARFVLVSADVDRGRPTAVDPGVERQAEQDLDSGVADLDRISEASTAGKMSRDDMTPAQRDLVDTVHRHAYAYADKAVGGLVLQTSDEAEQFAAYVVQRLIAQDFDDTYLSNPHLLRDFDRERAGRLAAKMVDDPDEKRWVARMALAGGMSTTDAGRGKSAAALTALAATLTRSGFYVERSTAAKTGVAFTLTGGRPHPSLVAPA